MDPALLAADALAVAGTLVLSLSVLGAVRSPDTSVRIHATSTAAMLGLPLVLTAVLLSGQSDLVLRALLVGAFSALTTPLGSYALAHMELDARKKR